ncbi:VOC family protein [Leptolyngbya sp. FACHB-261]|uniref:VOC family protein n=1 Tax=Leptolyngbya sp. FACHB-261 TaxID=2692806 RepID=UPI001689E4CB|nr:VOC family protein [Leptolyngbya sp. FACHB-261]MBD2102825.1 VOC family protein [Leptolyngbya sp. FACHB-261]
MTQTTDLKIHQPLSLNLHLHHFAISVTGLEETMNWYAEKLGFTPGFRYEMPAMNARVAFMTLNDFRIEVFELANSSVMPDYHSELATDLAVRGLKHIAFAVDDVEQAVAALKDRGVEFVTEIGEVPDSDGERFAFFKDNNGILIELYQPKA